MIEQGAQDVLGLYSKAPAFVIQPLLEGRVRHPQTIEQFTPIQRRRLLQLHGAGVFREGDETGYIAIDEAGVQRHGIPFSIQRIRFQPA